MIYNVLFLGFAVMTVPMILWIKRIERHDRVLFRFCHIRREAIALITESHVRFKRDDYIALRHLIEMLNMTINRYNECEIVIFNVRRLMRSLKASRYDFKGAEEIGETSDQSIKRLQNHYGQALIEAFLSYTPLIRLTLFRYQSGTWAKRVIASVVGIGAEVTKLIVALLEALRIEYGRNLSRAIGICRELVLKEQKRFFDYGDGLNGVS